MTSRALFDDLDVNSSKLGPTVVRRNEKLVKLLDAVGDLNLGTYSDNTIDAFGDAYEYLMTMYASSAGKSGGEFFTPQEVSELLARITVVGKKAIVPARVTIGRNCRVDPGVVPADFARRRAFGSGETVAHAD